MQLIWVFIGLLWLGIETPTGTISADEPVMYTEAVQTEKECQALVDSFKKSEDIMNEEPYIADGRCVLVESSWKDKTPVKQ